MVKVSVIVPVYNGERHLRQCLDSIRSQTLKDIQIICVDDGSTDSSPEILREYAEKDPRFLLLSQQNKFAGAARNLGKSHAKGEYLAFWDCDDWFEPSCLELMYTQSKKTGADLCVCGGNRWYENTKELAPNIQSFLRMKYVPAEVFNRDSNPDYIFNFATPMPWNKLYRRAFVEKYHLDFQAVRNGNDVYFTQCCVGLADRITTVDKALVNYRINQGTSLVDTVSKSPLTLFKAWIAVYETLSQYIQVPMRSYENKVVDIINHTLLNIKDHFAYAEAFRFLKEEGIEKLHITAHEDPDYFYFPWQKGFVDHLLADDLDTFKQYMLHATYRQVLDMELKLNALRNSNTFKVGDAIMRVPRDIKAFFKKS